MSGKITIVTEKEKSKSVPLKPKKAVFYCIKPDESQNFLFDSFHNEKIFCSHITLAFKPNAEMRKYFNKIVGESHILTVKHILKKESICSVAVLSSEDLSPHYFGDSEMHLTISTNGTPPSISNDVINEYNNFGSIYNEDGSKSIEQYLIDHEIKGKICGAIYGKDGLVYVDDPRFLK